MTENLLTVTQAAALAHVSTQLIRRMCKRGQLQAEKPGHDWLIDKASLTHWQNNRPRRGRPSRPVSPGGQETR